MQLPQRSRQDRAHSQPFASRAVCSRIGMRIVAQHDFAAPQALGGNAGIGLEPDSEIRGSSTGTSAANYLIAPAQSDRRTTSSRQNLSALGDYADRGFEVDFGDRSVWFISMQVFAS